MPEKNHQQDIEFYKKQNLKLKRINMIMGFYIAISILVMIYNYIQ